MGIPAMGGGGWDMRLLVLKPERSRQVRGADPPGEQGHRKVTFLIPAHTTN